MNGLKKIILVFSTVLILVSCICALSGCQNGNRAEEIFVESNNLPTAIYVEGEELDLSDGIITITTQNGKKTYVSMTDEGVSVSGYDKNKIGRQTVTLTYEEKTATIEVEVISRIIVDGYEKNYFIYDSFDMSKGKIKVAKGNGSSEYTTLNFNSSNVSLKSFDSSKVGETTATVTCTVGSKTYDCSFNVTIHDIANVEFNAPYKTDYKSHETEIDLLGGYLTVTAGDGSITKYVDLTSVTQTGFDPSAATKDNISSPLQETVTFNYYGHTFDFPINVTYSEIFIIKEAAELLSDIDWSADNPTFSEEQGNVAMDALKAYFRLGGADKAAVDKNDLITCLKPAVVAVQNIYSLQSLSFKDAFTVDGNGYLTIVATTPEEIEKAIKRLADTDDPYNVYSDLAIEILEEFSDEELKDGTVIGDYLKVHDENSLSEIIKIFEYMLELHENLENIPTDWTPEQLSDYDEDIIFATADILSSRFRGPGYNQIYSIVSSWRERNDYFDIIYSYYYYHVDDGKEEIANVLWGNIPAPGLLGEWYAAFETAVLEESVFESSTATTYLRNTVTYMYQYRTLLSLSEEILSGDNEFYKELYELLSCEDMISAYLKYAPRGYVFHMSSALGLAPVEDAWECYLDLYELLYLTPVSDITEFGTEIEAAFNKIFDLSPSSLHAFISSMNYQYDVSNGVDLIFDYSTKTYSYLSLAFKLYYEEILPEEVIPLFQKLLIAVENCSLCGVNDTAEAEFIKNMQQIASGYNALSTQDRAKFDKYLGKIYGKYSAIYTSLTAPEDVELGTYAPMFDELLQNLVSFYRLLSEFSSVDSETKIRILPVMFSLYERTNELYTEIMASEDPVITSALATKLYTVDGANNTLERVYFASRSVFISLLAYSGKADADGTNRIAWEIYCDADISAFLADISDLLLAGYRGEAYDGDIASILESYRALSDYGRCALRLLDIEVVYFDALALSVKDDLSDEEYATVGLLLEAYSSLSTYFVTKNDELLTELGNKVSELKTSYTSLADSSAFDFVFSKDYDLILAQYAKIGA